MNVPSGLMPSGARDLCCLSNRLAIKSSWMLVVSDFAVQRVEYRSGRPDVGQERIDFRAQDVGFAAQRAGCGQHLAGGCSGFSRGGADADDIAGNLRGAAGRVLNVAGDLARRRALLLDGGGDRGGDLVDLADGLADVPD